MECFLGTYLKFDSTVRINTYLNKLVVNKYMSMVSVRLRKLALMQYKFTMEEPYSFILHFQYLKEGISCSSSSDVS